MGIDQVRARWESVGRDDPLWAVLSHEGKEHSRWDAEEFLRLGVRDIEQVMDLLRVTGTTPEVNDALDFGCGVGRLTRPLARQFVHSAGVDVSAPMLELAEQLTGPDEQRRYVLNTTDQLPFAAGSFDLVLSLIVLQHLPRELAVGYVREFVRVLRSGGVAVFQIPSEQLDGSQSENPFKRRVMDALPSDWREEIHRRRQTPDVRALPMHGIPRAKVIKLVERSGIARVVACVEDDRAGPGWRSFTYVVRRSD